MTRIQEKELDFGSIPSSPFKNAWTLRVHGVLRVSRRSRICTLTFPSSSNTILKVFLQCGGSTDMSGYLLDCLGYWDLGNKKNHIGVHHRILMLLIVITRTVSGALASIDGKNNNLRP